MLMRAEKRYGNEDSVFEVEEQEEAFKQRYDTFADSNVRFQTSDQQLRLGLRVAF